MAGGFGYTVQAPMEIPRQVPYSPYSTGRPELADLPDIVDSSLSGLRLQATLAKALPKMAVIDTGSTVRAEETALEQYATRQAFDITRAYQARSKAIARLKDSRAQTFAERSAKPNTSRAYGKSKYDQSVENRAAYRAARTMTGPSVGPYMTYIRQNQGKDVP